MANASAGVQQPPERTILKVAMTAMAATSIEWYDFFIYGTAAALVFPALFFPEATPLMATLLSFGTFGVAFIGRPLGGVIFGHFGDKIGRKKVLVIALLLMGAATTLIGVLPTYATLGIWAPIVLTVLRFLQGIAIGGQWGGAVLLATESAPANRRGFYGSFAQVGVPVGVILANIVFLVVTLTLGADSPAFMSWGWRVPFLGSIILIGIGMYVQLVLEDTPAFRHLQEAKQQRDEAYIRQIAEQHNQSIEEARAEIEAEREGSPIIEAFRVYWRQIFLAAGAFVAINANFYIFISFILAYGTNPETLGLSQSTMLWAVLISSLVQIFALLYFAGLSDRFGRRGVYMAGAVLLGVWSFIFWPMVNTGSFLLITLALIIGNSVFLSMMYGPQAAFYSEIFSTRVRYSGASLGYQIGAIFGGGLAPLIATALLASFGAAWPIAVYMAAMCAITLVCVYLLTETYETDMDEVEAAHSASKAAGSEST
jgi:metabolite-proton symporter